MRVFITTLCCLLFTFPMWAQRSQNVPTIYIDKSGVMRWSDTGHEASFYGVNYTLPFAHAYRAMNYLGKDHKEAIDKDVYHIARLGFNAYRIHVWDVEISDGKGNLIENDHLDLLDYLIAKLKERNIRVLITTMTNFGNGYPERNQNTGAFSYLYDKCQVDSDENAIAAQENYISQFVKHTNPYTQLSYINDPFIVGFEINNEPCHADTPQQTERYINRMLATLKKAGNSKPVFYNVSHNMWHVQAYFNTTVQGTTYQWYPIGLVAGQTRKGNFLPYVDNYDISFSNVKGFDKKAKAVYEFDPADITYSYMYPAMARTFRSNGFQWITQFAYDPIDMAWANTEYQTHYLNLAYTPNKAISMKIAAEVAYSVPMNKRHPQYPNDTIFDNFRVSYTQDLSELNTPEKFYYSNNTSTVPVNADKLQSVAGCGSSPVVSYEGTGAYFIDRLETGLWRLEVMPDAVQINDPFAKPSLSKEVVTIAWNEWNMKIDLPGLGEDFIIKATNNGNSHNGLSKGIGFPIKPGVYLLCNKDFEPAKNWDASTKWGNITLGEYVAPKAHANTFSVVHQPAKTTENNQSLQIEAQIVGPSFPDSVIIYTDKISFWSQSNPYVKMERTHGYTYKAIIPADMVKEDNLRYNIIICKDDKNITFPASIAGNPLDWDFYQNKYYETKVVNPKTPVELVKITDGYSNIETYGIPESSYVTGKPAGNDLIETNRIKYSFSVKDTDSRFYWRKYIKDELISRKTALQNSNVLCLNIRNAEGINRLKAGFVTSDGFTYTCVLNLNDKTDLYRISLKDLQQDKTVLLPAPYPVFLDRYFTPEIQIPFDTGKIEMIILSTLDNMDEKASVEFGNMWLE
ncbi:hypothetical protein GGR21_003975 [Dysgonomonas hofstadii]|uniref:Cellulase (Glycosyl hydrolase family 5) n=1 Tax=Dysgonomonas hofstadii TaxID=637886 RepID=A0A840CV45_9BACT|nr:hypothetical protein [Dysgonomonas hofstadii]MBB4038048.1 hypothetical protein [Dysgonomonas hofstadii]